MANRKQFENFFQLDGEQRTSGMIDIVMSFYGEYVKKLYFWFILNILTGK